MSWAVLLFLALVASWNERIYLAMDHVRQSRSMKRRVSTLLDSACLLPLAHDADDGCLRLLGSPGLLRLLLFLCVFGFSFADLMLASVGQGGWEGQVQNLLSCS